MKTLKSRLSIFTLIFISVFSNAQTEGVSIKNTPSAPDASAMLDIESNTKGLLIPRVTLTSATTPGPITTPVANGLLVYNLSPSTSSGLQGKGFYYWDQANTKWLKVIAGQELWQLIPSTANNIIYDKGSEVKIVKLTGTAGNGLSLVETANSSITSLLHFSSSISTHTNVCGIDFHGWSSNLGNWPNLLHIHSNMLLEGDFRANGNITTTGVYIGSDSTLKTNILPLNGALGKILQLNAVTYDFKKITPSTGPCSPSDNTVNFIFDNKNHMGLIAQNVENIFPNVVQTTNGKKTVNYIELVTPLLEAIQEQQVIIDDLKRRVQNLETR